MRGCLRVVEGGRAAGVVLDATGAFGKSYRSLAPLGRLVCTATAPSISPSGASNGSAMISATWWAA